MEKVWTFSLNWIEKVYISVLIAITDLLPLQLYSTSSLELLQHEVTG